MKSGALKHLILIGSWCSYFYDQYFKGVIYEPIIKTRDLDFLVPVPLRLKEKIDIPALLGELEFLPDWSGDKGYIRMVHPELFVEFLVPEKGRGIDKPYPLPQLGVNAQTLRFLNFLTDNVIKIEVAGLVVNVPHPANFALHKLIIAQRRNKPDKIAKDKEAAVRILKALIEKGESGVIRKVFKSVPDKWQKKILKGAETIDDSEIINLLKDSQPQPAKLR
ncbi:MAG: GSU2403 family nucleotidyltransferase fold protein [bacterium]|nr:GSU2403 family nucleotidyltransferase fold protein [bacterium]